MLKVSYKSKYIILLFLVIAVIFSSKSSTKELTIDYPFDGSLFPPEIASPTFRWSNKNSGADSWNIRIDFAGDNTPLIFSSETMEWTPSREIWETIKEKSLGKKATVSIQGVKKSLGDNNSLNNKILSKKSITISTSVDSVGAPIFFRSVPLPFEYATQHMDEIKWCLGDISSDNPPKVILENMMMCGNCHSFSADGKVLGMDVDYANDKGSYIISGISEETMLTNDKVITWSDYKREDKELTFGLLSQISPDGEYAVSTVKDRSVFVPVDDLYYSQLFFPLKGILAYYSTVTKTFKTLPGAHDIRYVQSNPSWSPDGKYIVFAQNLADTLKNVGDQFILTQDQCYEYLEGGKKFRFDLYRIPFNDGKGGHAEAIEGASNNGMSNYFAKYSPEGKWIVFCKADSFMLLQPDSRLYIMPAEGGPAREMICNTNQMNSWHSWSPNSKWLVFSSKANTPYTQLFLTHIDDKGNDTPPILLSDFSIPDMACNIPEFVNIKQNGIKQIYGPPVDYYSYAREGDNFFYYEKYEDAANSYRKSIEMNPNFVMGHRKLANILMILNRQDEAEKELNIGLKLNPEDPSIHYNLGVIYMNRKEYDKAQKAFDASLKYDANFALGFEGMGVLLYNKGDYEKAKEKFITALNINSELLNSRYKLGVIYMMDKEYDKAQKQLEVIANTVVKNNFRSDVYTRLATIYVSKNQYQQAEKYSNMALAIESDNIEARNNLSAIYMQYDLNW